LDVKITAVFGRVRAVWDGEWGQSQYGVLDGVVIVGREGGSFGVIFGHRMALEASEG